MKLETRNYELGTSVWPHRWAVMLVCAVFPLLWVGGLVTTTQSGMAVPDWPNTYGYNLFLYPWTTWIFGPWDLMVEHGHRLLGALAGMLTIALCVSIWIVDSRRSVRWLSVAALVAVIGQGTLGGLRVWFDDRLVAMIHGCFGPAFFALCVGIAVLTSRKWLSEERPVGHQQGAKLQRLAMLTTLLAYVQLVLGALMRHVPVGADPSVFSAALSFHLLMAVVLLVHVGLVLLRVVRRHGGEAALRRPAVALAVLMCLQLVLGSATWVVNYGWPYWLDGYAWAAAYRVETNSFVQTHVTTAHVAAGSLILVTSLIVAMRSWRLLAAEPRLASRALPVAKRSSPPCMLMEVVA